MSRVVVTCQGWSHVKGGGHMSRVVTCQGWSHVKGGHMSNRGSSRTGGSSRRDDQLKITHIPLVFCF